MRWPLRYQIFVPFAVAMLVAIAGVSVFSAVMAARRTEAELAAELNGIAATLREATFPLSENVLRQMRGLSGAEFFVTAANGKTLAGTIDVPEQFSLRSARDSFAAEADEFDVERTLAMNGETYFYLATQTRPGSDGMRPTLHILYPEASWRESRSAAFVPPLVVGCAALVVVSLVSVVISRRLSGPIGQLREQVSRMAEGDYRLIERPARNDELRDLVESVNSLAGQLDALQQVIRRTERLSVLGQLSGGLAHELRNSVAGARLAVQLHQRACNERDPESLKVALRQLEITESQLRRFLAVGKPSPPSRSRFDLSEAAAEVVALVRPTSDHRKISISLEYSQPGIEIEADRDQICQLLLNLALNAIEAAGSGGRIRIVVDSTKPHDARLQVTDSGPGPASEIADRLFEPFVTSKPEGVGLGLAVAQQIAEAHGGTITCKRTTETTFEVVLPRQHSGTNSTTTSEKSDTDSNAAANFLSSHAAQDSTTKA
jgi:signal transduction histidine kinase